MKKLSLDRAFNLAPVAASRESAACNWRGALAALSRDAATLSVFLSVLVFASTSWAADKKVVFIAGTPSHESGGHEHRAGCLLLKSCLDKVPGITSVVYSNGWPHEANAFEGADAVVMYADGGDGHPALRGDHKKILGDLVKKGVGIGCLHYAVEVPKEKAGAEFLQ